MNRTTRYIFSIIMLAVAVIAKAQIRGVVIDASNGDTIPYASVVYRGRHIAAATDRHGQFSIARHNGWNLSFSDVGYKTKTIKVTPNMSLPLTIKLVPDTKQLQEVKVTSKKQKYSRKENPAVELMRRVIARKVQTKLENKPFYQYRNYEKLTVALNDISKAAQDSGIYSRKKWMKNQLEVNPVTGKTVLPVMVTEKVFRKFYRRDPEKVRIMVDAEKSYGVNELIETGNIFTTAANDVFTEVDVYDDQMRLLQYPFTSPISNSAINFYRFYITDTCEVAGDSCIEVSFVPNNQQDFGFRGNIWILKDSTLHVKKVHLSIPNRSDVNFVRNMAIDQEYERLPSGDWVLSVNDMIVEMTIVGELGNFLITRTSRRTDYSFDTIPEKTFRGKAVEKHDPYAEMRGDGYWAENREVGLTSGEEGMDAFLRGLKSTKGFGWLMVGLKAVMENYIETTKQGNPSKVDIGPFTSTISRNDIDGFRLRASAQTTAALNPHLFLKGYYAHGFSTNNDYYSGTVTYSFNKKAYGPDEYPMRNISFTSTYDICSPSDRFLNVDKDNIFAVLKWSKVEKMAFYKRQELKFQREEDWGFAMTGGLKFEENEATGDWNFFRIGEARPTDGSLGRFRTSEVYMQLEYSPGQTYVNSKQRRRTINRDAPIFKLKHTMGINGFMGGQYNYHVTEASIYKRFWLRSWGKFDARLKGGVQWSQVPFPLLIAPAANLAYIWVPETFELVENMEFLNDHYASLMLEWDANGKIFNRIPLLKKLQLRELFGFSLLWGGLTNKNNPALASSGVGDLMAFPNGCHVMNPDVPYMEFRVGIHNIFKLLSVEYVRRINYLDYGAVANGVRFGFRVTF